VIRKLGPVGAGKISFIRSLSVVPGTAVGAVTSAGTVHPADRRQAAVRRRMRSMVWRFRVMFKCSRVFLLCGFFM
jgi:ABC-type polar amino acid transport system ATPase subunit